jgi:hypothetical protein
MTSSMRKKLLDQPHRASAANPATAACAMWLSPEQLEQQAAKHAEAGRRLVDEIPCGCGNHLRRMYA